MGAMGEAFRIRMVIMKPEHLPPLENGETRYSDDVVAEFEADLTEFMKKWAEEKQYLRSSPRPETSTEGTPYEFSIQNVPWNG